MIPIAPCAITANYQCSKMALTHQEYTARWKERDPDGYRAAMKRKQEKRKANRKAKKK